MSSRITYPDKSNNPSDPDNIRKYFASEADEVKAVINAHADEIEDILSQLISSPNPYYGRFTSLAVLEAAYPVGEVNAWAIIDLGAGVTPQIAAWDNIGAEWEIVGYTENIIFVANAASLPGTGVQGKSYITLDKDNLYLWYNSQYNLIGGKEFATKTENATKLPHGGYGGTAQDLKDLIAAIISGSGEVKISNYFVDTIGNTNIDAFEIGNTFRGWPTTSRYVVGKVIALPFDIDDNTKVSLVVDNEI